MEKAKAQVEEVEAEAAKQKEKAPRTRDVCCCGQLDCRTGPFVKKIIP